MIAQDVLSYALFRIIMKSNIEQPSSAYSKHYRNNYCNILSYFAMAYSISWGCKIQDFLCVCRRRYLTVVDELFYQRSIEMIQFIKIARR